MGKDSLWMYPVYTAGYSYVLWMCLYLYIAFICKVIVNSLLIRSQLNYDTQLKPHQKPLTNNYR